MSASSMKSAIVGALVATLLALPVASTASAAAPSLGTITVQGGTVMVPGSTATVDVMCPQVGTTANGAELFAPVASIWLSTPQGQMLVWQVSSQQPGACVWITGTGIRAFEMPTEATISVPSTMPAGPMEIVGRDYHGNIVATGHVVVAGTVTKPSTGSNPYLTVPTGKAGKGAKTSATTASSASFRSTVTVVAPRTKTPWWTTLLKRVIGLF